MADNENAPAPPDNSPSNYDIVIGGKPVNVPRAIAHDRNKVHAWHTSHPDYVAPTIPDAIAADAEKLKRWHETHPVFVPDAEPDAPAEPVDGEDAP